MDGQPSGQPDSEEVCYEVGRASDYLCVAPMHSISVSRAAGRQTLRAVEVVLPAAAAEQLMMLTPVAADSR